MLTLAAPEIAGLPSVIAGLVAAGALAAALSTANALILAVANSLGHDVYYKMIDPRADAAIRLIAARVLLVVSGIAASVMASLQTADILTMMAWAFSLACSGLFFPLVLGIWWRRANPEGALAGMIVGFASGVAYLFYMRNGGAPIFGLDELRFGIVGMGAGLAAQLAVTLATPAPDAETLRRVDQTRLPAGPSAPDPVA